MIVDTTTKNSKNQKEKCSKSGVQPLGGLLHTLQESKIKDKVQDTFNSTFVLFYAKDVCACVPHSSLNFSFMWGRNFHQKYPHSKNNVISKINLWGNMEQ